MVSRRILWVLAGSIIGGWIRLDLLLVIFNILLGLMYVFLSSMMMMIDDGVSVME